MSETDKNENGQAGNPATSFLQNAYKAGMGAAETMHRTAVEIPLNILEQMGVESEKITMLRSKSSELIGDLYATIDSVASKSGVVGTEAEKADNKSAD